MKIGKLKSYYKVTNRVLDKEFLSIRNTYNQKYNYPKQRWIQFCEYFIKRDFKVSLYEARKTRSKYVTVYGNFDLEFVVRFSDHPTQIQKKGLPPSDTRRCDFFVGPGFGNCPWFTLSDGISATINYFKSPERT